MGKKAILFIIIGAVLGVALAGGGIFFMLKNGGEKPVEEEKEVIVEEFDLTQGQRLTLEKVQIPLAISDSKTHYLQADFTIIFKNAEMLTKAEGILPDIKEAIYGVFEIKTAQELKVQANPEGGNITSPREAMKEPVLNAIRSVFFTEEEKDAVAAVVISSFIVQ